MSTEDLFDYFCTATYTLLEEQGTEANKFFSRVEYMPYECLLVKNNPSDINEFNRVHAIGLWATLFSSIGFVSDKMEKKQLNPDQLRVAFQRVSHMCSLLLTGTNLPHKYLVFIRSTPYYKHVEKVLMDGIFIREFSGDEFENVRRCFSNIGLEITTQEFRGIRLDDDSDTGKATGEVTVAPGSLTFNPGFAFSANAQPQTGFAFSANAQQVQNQSAAAPSSSMSVDEALHVLGFGKEELLGGNWITQKNAIKKRVSLIVSTATNDEISAKAKEAGQFLINYSKDNAGYGGKRRTMKVKKHFRKTKKRFVKKGKKTRVRRNK
jgi:hypothetical protein